jgi:hypothetical protein
MKDHVNVEFTVDLSLPIPKIWHAILKSGMPHDEAREFMKYVRAIKCND